MDSLLLQMVVFAISYFARQTVEFNKNLLRGLSTTKTFILAKL